MNSNTLKENTMTRNWYLICTATNKENKVASILSKKGIESFCPTVVTEVKISASKTITQVLPLFSSYVFAFMNEAEIAVAKSTSYVNNLAYWKSQPAVINQNEISALKGITENYTKINAENIGVNENGVVKVKALTNVTMGAASVNVQHKGVAITLPTLGFKVTAERTAAAVLVNQPAKVSFAKKIAASFSF